MKKIFFLLFGFFALIDALSGQTMMADITTPVESEFATYYPISVSVHAKQHTCEPGENLEHVANLSFFNFSPAALSLLKKNHFVVTPGFQSESKPNQYYNEIFDIYCQCREKQTPIFVTSDALLHTFHLCFDHILKTCEEKHFFHQLNLLLSLLLDETECQFAAASSVKIKAAITSNYNYLLVAKKLLDSTYVEKINGGPYLQELSLISASAGFAPSPIFGYEEDYSQYRVRGHYTRSSLLRHYFKSMMWLGRMSFCCDNVQQSACRDATLRALLLCQAMQKISPQGMQWWDEIYQPTVFFVGKSDDINFLHYIPLAKAIYGDSWNEQSPEIFNDEILLTNFLEKAQTLTRGAISYAGQPQRGFRFMGQRFIPDSWILDELVFNKIPSRYLPSGLDVMYVLGSDRAKAHFKPQDLNNFAYLAKLDSLRTVFAAYPPETWAQNVYWNWLYSLMPLLTPKTSGYPYFMQTLAWQDKDLFAALAAWAELRHDTILYAKQSGTETSMPPAAILRQGYVEPNPYLFARLAALANYMLAGLQQRNLIFEEFHSSLQLFSKTAVTLKEIAEKELNDIPLTSDEYHFIFDIGKTLYSIATFGKGNFMGPLPGGQDGLEPMPVIADVHTDANTMTVLEEGVGHPFVIYVICCIEGMPVIAKGAGYSYYEFSWPANDRLTDEKWRKMLQDGASPAPPSWITSFSTALPNNLKTESAFYRWQKPYSHAINVSLNKQSACIGDTITISIDGSDYYDLNFIPLKLTDPMGKTFTITANASSESSPRTFTAFIYTSVFNQCGRYYVDIIARTGADSVCYRTHFDLQSAMNVISRSNQTTPSQMLMHTYPNPFNASTRLIVEASGSAAANIEIFDIQGKLIRVLFSGYMNKGRHELSWDGHDASNNMCPSGVYLCRVNLSNTSRNFRMLLVR